MKRTKKKSVSKASHKKTVKDLEIKPAKGGTVRGGHVLPGELSEPVAYKTSPGG